MLRSVIVAKVKKLCIYWASTASTKCFCQAGFTRFPLFLPSLEPEGRMIEAATGRHSLEGSSSLFTFNHSLRSLKLAISASTLHQSLRSRKEIAKKKKKNF